MRDRLAACGAGLSDELRAEESEHGKPHRLVVKGASTDEIGDIVLRPIL